MASTMHDVFVSYARADRDRVEPLVELMEANGLSVWWDAEVVPGSTFEQVIDDALIGARLVVVVWTRESIHSDWVQAEAGDGLERGILIPVMLDPVRVPVAFRRKQTVNLFGWPEKQDHGELTRFLAAAMETVGKPVAEPRLPPRARPQIRQKLRTTAFVFNRDSGCGVRRPGSADRILRVDSDAIANTPGIDSRAAFRYGGCG